MGVAGLAVVLALAVYGDVQATASALAGFPIALIPTLLLLASASFSVRFLRWHLLLLTAGSAVPLWDSVLIFACGLGMTITPGKIGEWVKSYLLKDFHGVAVGRSAPVVLTERITDGVALLVLSSAGFVLFSVAL